MCRGGKRRREVGVKEEMKKKEKKEKQTVGKIIIYRTGIPITYGGGCLVLIESVRRRRVRQQNTRTAGMFSVFLFINI